MSEFTKNSQIKIFTPKPMNRVSFIATQHLLDIRYVQIDVFEIFLKALVN